MTEMYKRKLIIIALLQTCKRVLTFLMDNDKLMNNTYSQLIVAHIWNSVCEELTHYEKEAFLLREKLRKISPGQDFSTFKSAICDNIVTNHLQAREVIRANINSLLQVKSGQTHYQTFKKHVANAYSDFMTGSSVDYGMVADELVHQFR